MKKTVKRIVLIIVLIFVIGAWSLRESEANWCVTLRDLTKPDVITARAIVSFYKEPWTEWLQKVLVSKFANRELSDLKTVYKMTSGNFLFIDAQFNLKPSANAIIREFAGEVKNREQLGALVHDLEKIRYDLAVQFPSGVDPDVVMVCPSQDPEKAFYTSGEPLDSEREKAVIKWANNQKKTYETLAEKALQLDSLFVVSFVSLFRSKTPYASFYWVSLVDNETAMVNFLKYDGLDNLPVYKILRNSLPKYEQLANSSQVTVTFTEKLKPGSRGAAVSKIQQRLIQEGYMDGSPSGFLDEKTREALIKFQRTHFVTPDGTVGQKTIEKMNIPFTKKAEWIRTTLEGLAETPLRIYNRFIWVNIPTFSLEYYDDGKLVSRHKVIVGRADGKEMKIKGKIIKWNNTLPLVSEIKSVVINPRWYVPERIRIELEKEAMNDEFYFQKRGFRALDSTYSWGEPRLYQLPGGKNPLGKAKFLFDNPYGFYLHDTPEQHLFRRASRAISHGCIRVERALDLAREILTKENPKRAEQIESYLKKPDQTYITLENPVPIVITYFPVSAGEDGLLEFGGDPYGWEDTNGFKGFFYVKNDQGM